MDKLEKKFLNAFCNKMKWQFFKLKLKLLFSGSNYLDWKLEPTRNKLVAYTSYKNFWIEFIDSQILGDSYYTVKYKNEDPKTFYIWKSLEQYIGQKIKEEKIGLSLDEGWSR